MGKSKHICNRRVTYFELPVAKTEGDLAFSRKNIGNAMFDFTKSYSRSSIILRKSKNGYSAYLMTILADSTYLNGDLTKLNKNTYLKKDEHFSGLVFFHTLNGKFNNGWRYNDGKITGTISQNQGTAGSNKIVQGIKTLGCESFPTYSYTMSCTTTRNSTRVYESNCTQQTNVNWNIICDYVIPQGKEYNIDGGNTRGGITEPLPTASFTEKIDDSKLADCFKSVLENLKNVDYDCVGNTVSKFSGENPGYNWTVKDGYAEGNNGQTSPLYNRQTGTVTTTFNSSNFISGSDLAIAKTILHESVHAYLVAYFRNDYTRASSNYSQLVDDYNFVTNQDLNAAQHNEVVRTFIGQIATTLEQYGQLQGYKLDYEFYSDLAWGGLTDKKAFKSLSQKDQDRILDTIYSEQNGTDRRSGNLVNIKGTASGCK